MIAETRMGTDWAQICAQNSGLGTTTLSPEGARRILTPGDLRELTGYAHMDKQRSFLEANGIFFMMTANGKLIVLWSSVEAAAAERRSYDPEQQRLDAIKRKYLK
ncbi:DUF4224 domain-containing protein [Ferrimonas balearica]|uniref:DUF4224 domain-containing protein n=1 Tax=Ferrimonas balearica TaxID=44012 RepID=UPI001C98A124|nr:DUF4224 domain-containing protein [Ferrimonas balearica]MBY6104972.1 DUF4224 domain-containing protein [Ferrimonas balearica]